MKVKKIKLMLGCVLAMVLLAGATGFAQSPTTLELKDTLGKAPTAETLTKGDAAGALTGTISDVTVSDEAAGLTLGDVGNQVGQNKIAINFMWTLIAGFMVMFMQAGFAFVEAGLCRAKNANHTYMMNFAVYACGLFAYWLIGFSIQMGGCGGALGGALGLNTEHTINLFGKTWGIFGGTGMFLSGQTYDVAVMVIFLFQMVFMDTALTIVTGAGAERWKFLTFCVSSMIMGAFTYPLFANWAWGTGWLGSLGDNLGLGANYSDFAGSGVVHAVGGLSGLGLALIMGPRIGKYNRDGSSNSILGHDISAVLVGCFILAFGWFGFNPGSTLGASGALRISTIAVNTMLAGCTGTFGAMLYMWCLKGKPDASMSGNGLLAGLVAITAPCAWVNTMGAAIIGVLAGVLVCLSAAYVENVMKVDDPVGAVSVHGTCGLFGLIAVGLFADGSYGVTGLFYGGGINQLVAQLIGISTLIGFVFTTSFVINWVLDILMGQRTSAESEVEGLDIPEMGQLGYPEYVLKAEPEVLLAAEQGAVA